ncbi:hypothetical protein GS597_00680 [Synechococcales cyanobacterium C]|uniref:Uncharacterized protein n=1 Tax=Petrachloros mirabilis ULC683 TaxID=2781853 RepID=A0A8K1ZVS2_9CYAN|nr:hypothetical protein [Petrachloros mirabilis]NCJ05056.1 hypothetical protein [Petrachloros mirabilis ULC683]
MDYLHYLGTASLVLRVIQHLRNFTHLDIEFVSVIHQLNGWVLRVKPSSRWSQEDIDNFQAFLNELGVPYRADWRLQAVLSELEAGHLPVEVMRRYQVAVIAHGNPDLREVEAFREQFIQGLGYCPETLA